MSASEIIDEIQRLPPADQAEVMRFARRFDGERQLSPVELEEVGRRLVEATDPKEVERITDELVRGFYGGRVNA